MITVGSNTSDLNSVFTDEGCLILHKIQLGSEEWRSVLHQQIAVLNRKLDLAGMFLRKFWILYHLKISNSSTRVLTS